MEMYPEPQTLEPAESLSTPDSGTAPTDKQAPRLRFIVKVISAVGILFLWLINAFLLSLLDVGAYSDIENWIGSISFWIGFGGGCIVAYGTLRHLSLCGITGCIAGLSVLAMILVPNAMASRGRSRMATSVGSVESVRAAIAAYAADSAGNSFPATMANWGELTMIVNANGATLKNTAAKQGFHLRGYTAIDHDSDGIFEDYTMSLLVDGIPDTDVGRLILVSPSGIDKTKP
jgi:hypothetical protein